MSPKRRSAEKSKLRMDIYSNNDKNARQKGVSDKRREIDRVIKKARRDGDTTSTYWTKKLLEVEEKEPDRWRHSGYKELYVDSKKDSPNSVRNDSPVAKKRSGMYSPSAPTSPLPPSRNSRRSSTPSRQNDRSISSDVRRGSPPRSRTDKFASSSRQRSSVSPVRRAKSPARSPLRRSRSPMRRNKSTARRPSPLRRTRSPPSPRVRKLSPRRAKSPPPSRSGRSPLPIRTKSPSSRLLKSDRTRNRSNDKSSPPVRRKKSPKLARYKSVSRSLSLSPARRRDKMKVRSPLAKAATKRRAAHRMKYRRSSSSKSRFSSASPTVRRKNLKQTLTSEVLSSTDCSDSNCSMCKFEKSTKEKKKTKPVREKIAKRTSPPKEPRLKPRTALPRLPPTSSSRYARSRSLSAPVANPSPVEERRPPELKRKKKSKKKEKKTVLKPSQVVTTSIIHNKKIKVESPSDESESPSPKRISLSERFGKMAKWNQKKELESNQRNIRVTAGDSYRVEELDVPLMEPFPEPPPLLLDGSWDDVRVRYTYYKDQGYLEDLTFQDYLKWEEWWYSYQEWLDNERLHSIRRRL